MQEIQRWHLLNNKGVYADNKGEFIRYVDHLKYMEDIRGNENGIIADLLKQLNSSKHTNEEQEKHILGLQRGMSDLLVRLEEAEGAARHEADRVDYLNGVIKEMKNSNQG